MNGSRTYPLAVLLAVLLSPTPAPASPFAEPYHFTFEPAVRRIPLSLPPATRRAVLETAKLAPQRPPAQDNSLLELPGRHLLYAIGGRGVSTFPQGIPEAGYIADILSGIAFAMGGAVDQQLNFYVANQGNGTVTVYHPGEVTPFRIFESLPGADGVTVDASGNVYVSCFDYNGGVYVFRRGAQLPFRFIRRPYAYAAAVDAGGDVFVEYNITQDFGQGRVVEYLRNSDAGKDLGIKLGWSGGIAIDANGDLLVGDQGGIAPRTLPRVATYRVGTSTPIRSMNYAFASPTQIAVDTTGTHFYVSSLGYTTRGIQLTANVGFVATTYEKFDFIAGGGFGIALSR